jgi:hypothetical protein
VRSRDKIVEQVDGSFCDLGLVEELDDQREIDFEPQNVRGVDLAARAEAGNAPENGDLFARRADPAEG